MSVLVGILLVPVILFLLVFAGIGYVVNYERQAEPAGTVMVACLVVAGLLAAWLVLG